MKTFPIYLSLLWCLLNNAQTGYAAQEKEARLVELDAGGYFSHFWEAAPVVSQEQQVRLAGRTFMLSPFRYEVRGRISVDGGPFVNFGTVRWERVEEDSP